MLALALAAGPPATGHATAQEPARPQPSYRATGKDPATADNRPRAVAHPAGPCAAEAGCYLPDPNPASTEGLPVDSHTGDIYERPTAPGAGATRVTAAVDVVSARVGSDDAWFYFRIELAGRAPDGKHLPHAYGFELDFDDDPAGELLVVVSNPSASLGTAFGTTGMSAHWNQNSDIFGPTAELPDGPIPGDGYEVLAFEGGANRLEGRRAVGDPLRGRVAARGAAVELAVRRRFLDALKENAAGIDISGDVNKVGLRANAAVAPIDPSAFTRHDRVGRRQSGSPYPFLRLRPTDPATCPFDEQGLSLADREALDSGTDQDSGIPNPCYPAGAVAQYDNAYYVTTTYTPEEVAGQPAGPVEGELPAAGEGGPAAGEETPVGMLLLAGVVAPGGAVLVALRRRDRRRGRAASGDGPDATLGQEEGSDIVG